MVANDLPKLYVVVIVPSKILVGLAFCGLCSSQVVLELI